MKAIETTGQINQEGAILLDQPLVVRGKKVKIIILMEEDEKEEKEWLSTMSTNPAFDFLKDEQEDIYSITDGKPLND
ncbi:MULTISPECIES: hypothetical protein [Cyclobacterium]|uniref:Uncharacterized protein n=1 Tax=Cyclobacterium plantarum TaxID=2716263 RepID=A0ABX0HHK9_9BACT|nr:MULTISPECIES: hypothetical protein [Cyclobacterium]NHE59596.1 hypothetical protein [Cyclobacterium plantarum]